jgi:PAS domain S-box-containing protein
MAEECRRRPAPAIVAGFLEQLPAVVLLNRISIPMLAVADDGIIVFANPACQGMLGHAEDAVTGQPLNHFLHVTAISASDSVAALRDAAGQITAWQHARDEIVQAVVSQPLLMRAEDPILLVGLTDVTEWLWTAGPDAPHWDM